MRSVDDGCFGGVQRSLRANKATPPAKEQERSSKYLNGYLEVSPVGVGRSTVEFRESLRKIGIDRKAAAVLKVWYNLIWLLLNFRT